LLSLQSDQGSGCSERSGSFGAGTAAPAASTGVGELTPRASVAAPQAIAAWPPGWQASFTTMGEDTKHAPLGAAGPTAPTGGVAAGIAGAVVADAEAVVVAAAAAAAAGVAAAAGAAAAPVMQAPTSMRHPALALNLGECCARKEGGMRHVHHLCHGAMRSVTAPMHHHSCDHTHAHSRAHPPTHTSHPSSPYHPPRHNR
jgi:hypothetical protein